jgi:hypothetical protein
LRFGCYQTFLIGAGSLVFIEFVHPNLCASGAELPDH